MPGRLIFFNWKPMDPLPTSPEVTAPDGAADDGFGRSVSQSGNILAVGAYNADPGGLSNAGAAYLFQLEANGSATYLTKVTAPDGPPPIILESRVSLSGNILAVGAYLADPGGLSDAGAVYLYQLEANGSATYLNKVTASDGAAGDKFGFRFPSRAIFLPSGHTHYADPGGTSEMPEQSIPLIWLDFLNFRKKLLLPMVPPDDLFGYSVSQSGNILAVGAYQPIRGAFRCRSGLSLSSRSQWIRHLPDQGNRSRWSRNDNFGYSVSQSGNILAVGARYADPGGLSNAGAAYLYQLEANGSATYLTKVTAPDGAATIILDGLRFPVGQYSTAVGAISAIH